MEGLAGRVILLWGWRRSLLAILAGAIAVLGQAPFDFPAACFVAFPILVWLLDGVTTAPGARLLLRMAPAFAVGWWFGLGYFLAGLWWIGNALLVEADSFAWALPLAVLALPAGLALFYGLATALARLLWSDGLGRIAALAAAFCLVEFLRSVLFTGFPWNPIGFAAMPVPIAMQSVALVGTYGMNALAVFVFASPALLGTRRGARIGLAMAAALLLAHLGFGMVRLSTNPASASAPFTVRLVQPSIDQSEKWNPAVRERILQTYLDLSRSAGTSQPPALLVWPETAFPYLATERPEALEAIGAMLQPGQMLLVGAVRSEGESGNAVRYYNSVLAIDDHGEIDDAADKVHLVPFGEYIPFEDLLSRFGVRKIVSFPLSFSAGAERRKLQLPGGISALPLICYEIIFPGTEADAAAGVGVIVNLTNDAWFGDTPGPYQHFRQAQLRAVETGLPLVRAANNGISGGIDAYGRVEAALALDERGTLDVSITPGSRAILSNSWRNLNIFLVALVFATIAGILNLVSRAKERRLGRPLH